MGGEWRYFAARLNGDGTSTIIDPDLPLSGVSLTKVLSGPDGLSCSIEPAYTRLLGPDGNPLLQRYSTAIFAEEGGDIRHGTILTDVGRDGPKLSLTGVGFSAYPKGKPYQGDVFRVQVDPLDIVREVWTYLQGRPKGNLGVTLGQQKVGVKIGTVLQQAQFDTQNGPVSFESGPIKLNWWETDDLGKFQDEYATTYGFDYTESHSWNADRTDFLHRIDFGVPRLGTRRDLRFVVGENVMVPPSDSAAASVYASEVIVRGAGEGRTMVRGYASRPGEARLANPVVIDDKSIKSVKAANQRAAAELALRTGRPILTDVTVMDSDEAPMGSWAEGDEVEIVNEGEWGQSADWYRILSTTISPEDSSAARLAVVPVDMIPA